MIPEEVNVNIEVQDNCNNCCCCMSWRARKKWREAEEETMQKVRRQEVQLNLGKDEKK